MCPILVTMYLRIYRVKRVFELYEKFLDKMMVRSGSIFSSYGYMSSQLALRKSLARTFDNSKSMTNYNEQVSLVSEAAPDGLRKSRLMKNDSDTGSQSSERIRFQSEHCHEERSLLKEGNFSMHTSQRTSSLKN